MFVMDYAPIPVEDFVQAIEDLVEVDRTGCPYSDGASLYIRPFVFATDVGMGVHASRNYTFCVICAPSGAYYAEGIDPVRIYVEDEYIRAAPGLTGFTKCGGNYAASIKAGEMAEQQGFAQVLWLDGVVLQFLQVKYLWALSAWRALAFGGCSSSATSSSPTAGFRSGAW